MYEHTCIQETKEGATDQLNVKVTMTTEKGAASFQRKDTDDFFNIWKINKDDILLINKVKK